MRELNGAENMSYRYLSLLRPLGCWLSIEQPYTIETPTETDVDPFRPDWPAHDVLVTEEPLPKERIESLQLTDLSEMQKRKILYDKLFEMSLNVKAAIYEVGIKAELGDKIRSGKIRDEVVLGKMVDKYVKYVNS